MPFPHLHLAPDHRSGPPADALSNGSDIGLLGFLVAVHLLVLIGFLLGIGWGEGVGGYATVIVLVGGRELVRELAQRFVDGGRRSS